ncbi:MAG: GNAT family N-acetyltransferase [Anaerolineae bacterium]|nr:GNAT family N-acetyltransferase [Anaerolineae bacterium]
MTLNIRNLHTPDVDAANEILVAAFQSSRSYQEDLNLYLTLAPNDWYLAVWDGVPAGVVGVVNYGPVAYVGFMAVHPDFQRKGIAEALMKHGLAKMEAAGCPIALLDASAMGEPLYRKLGFVDDGQSAQYWIEGSLVRKPTDFQSIDMDGVTTRLMHPADIPNLVQLDTPIFGANRERLFLLLIETLPERSFVAEDTSGQLVGFVFSQPKRIGPLVALNPPAAEALLQAALSVPSEGRVMMIAPVINPFAQELVLKYGFQHFRTNAHMRYGGTQHPGRRELIYSLMSFAIG